MLDELIEFKQYTGTIANSRFDVDTAGKKGRFVGLDRPLSIIARYELERLGFFDESSADMSDEELLETMLPKVVTALKSWLGFESDSSYAYDMWFMKYFKKLYADAEGKKQAELYWDEFQESSKKMDITLFGFVNSEENYLLSSTYQKVIAEAVLRGPLKKYYLVCKPGFADELSKHSADGNLKPFNLKNKTDLALAENFLRLICAYLIEKNRTGQEWCHISNADLSHWARCFQISKNPQAYFEKIKYGGDSIVSCGTVARSYAQRYISPEYLAAYDFQVVEADSFDASLYPGYVRYEDQGAGKPLKSKKL